jgi:hypothetical protein
MVIGIMNHSSKLVNPEPAIILSHPELPEYGGALAV